MNCVNYIGVVGFVGGADGVDEACGCDWFRVVEGDCINYISSNSWLIIHDVCLCCGSLSTESVQGAMIGSKKSKWVPLFTVSNGLPYW